MYLVLGPGARLPAVKAASRQGRVWPSEWASPVRSFCFSKTLARKNVGAVRALGSANLVKLCLSIELLVAECSRQLRQPRWRFVDREDAVVNGRTSAVEYG